MSAVRVEETLPTCSDCGCVVTNMGPAAIMKGSSVREPGEPLCGSCSSTRTKMVRELDAIPNTLEMIRAKRRWERPR